MTKLYCNNEKITVLIQDGELVSYKAFNIEIIHQKGDPGWGNSEIEMFPIIGPTKENDFTVVTPKGKAKLDQHGILRAMKYIPVISEKNKASFCKKYKANTKVKNPKYPNKSSQEWLDWPYDFEFIKTFELTDHCLKVSFKVKSEEGMPFMLGFHPAFKINGSNPEFKTKNKNISLKNILDAGSSALLVEKTKELSLKNNGELIVDIKTSNFIHIMLWTEVKNMVCIEPITFYPYSVSTNDLHKGFDFMSNDQKNFEVTITPRLSS